MLNKAIEISALNPSSVFIRPNEQKPTKRFIMRKNVKTAEIDEDNCVISATHKAPVLIQKNTFAKWEKSRETDVNRTNLRVLRRLLGLGARDTKQALQRINYASLFDTFWVKDKDSQLVWEDIKFTSNPLFYHALCGADVTESTPFKSPEHSNIGSYEKGWRLMEDGKWCLYKQGTVEEIWSEIFSSELLRLYLGDRIVRYRKDGAYSVCENFINQDKDECLEHYFSFGSDNVEEHFVLSLFQNMGFDDLTPDLMTMWYADALVQNGDRHEFNFGIITSDEQPRLSPLYDWNLSMIAYRYPTSYTRYEDPLVKAVKGLHISTPFIVQEKDIREVYRYLTDSSGLVIKATEDEIAHFILSAQDLLQNSR